MLLEILKDTAIFLILLATTEAIIKPLLKRLMQVGIKNYIKPAFDKLDFLIAVPDNWREFTQNASDFIFQTIIPPSMDEAIAAKLTTYLIKNFDLQTHISKINEHHL